MLMTSYYESGEVITGKTASFVSTNRRYSLGPCKMRLSLFATGNDSLLTHLTARSLAGMCHQCSSVDC